jgi:hypothetical protein
MRHLTGAQWRRARLGGRDLVSDPSVAMSIGFSETADPTIYYYTLAVCNTISVYCCMLLADAFFDEEPFSGSTPFRSAAPSAPTRVPRPR